MLPLLARALPGVTRNRAEACSLGKMASSRLHPLLPAVIEQFTKVRARAIEPRAHGADRQVERLGHVLVRELPPCEEQERLALLVRERFDRVGHPRDRHARVHRGPPRAPIPPLAGPGPPRGGAPPSGPPAPGLP